VISGVEKRSLLSALPFPPTPASHFLLEITRQFIFTRHINNIFVTYLLEDKSG